MKYTRKQRAAALIADVPTADMSEEQHHLGAAFTCNWHTSVLILTDREADSAARLVVQRDLEDWITTGDLAWMAGISPDTAAAILETPDATRVIEMLLTAQGTLDKAITSAIRDAGGRGPVLATHDGEEHEQTVGGVRYYGYRI